MTDSVKLALIVGATVVGVTSLYFDYSTTAAAVWLGTLYLIHRYSAPPPS